MTQKENAMTANERQVGGTHYKTKYEHWDFVTNVGMSYLGAQVCKYLKRWRDKNGLEDVEKSLHFLDKMIELSPILIMHKPNIPRTYISAEIDAYLRANDIKGEEAAVTSVLAQWACRGDLLMAKCYIEVLIDKINTASTSAGPSGGVGGAHGPTNMRIVGGKHATRGPIDSDESIHAKDDDHEWR